MLAVVDAEAVGSVVVPLDAVPVAEELVADAVAAAQLVESLHHLA